MTTPRSRTRPRLTALLLLPLLALLSGCFRVGMDFTFNPDDTVDFVFEMVDRTGSGATSDCTEDDLADGPVPDGVEVRVESFEEDGYPGCRMTAHNVPLAEFDTEDDMTLYREGDLYVFEIPGDDSGSIPPTLSGGDMQVSVTFPGSVVDASGGEVDGSTVTWTGLGPISSGIRATGEADASADVGLIIAIVLAVVVLVGAVIAIVVILGRRKKAAAGGGSPQGSGWQGHPGYGQPPYGQPGYEQQPSWPQAPGQPPLGGASQHPAPPAYGPPAPGTGIGPGSPAPHPGAPAGPPPGPPQH